MIGPVRTLLVAWLAGVLILLPGSLRAGDVRDRFDFVKVGPEDYWPMRRELRAYFPDHCQGRPKDPAMPRHWKEDWDELRKWAKAHPEADALDVRCENYRVIGRTFLPILFRESPFYFEASVPD